MRFALAILVAVCSFQIACSNPREPASKPAASQQSAQSDPARITQFYATAPRLAAGEKELLCYGVANAKNVWLSPPRQELSAALSRCVEVTPRETTTYTLTAEGQSGRPATSELTVTLGPPKVKIINVTVSSLSVKPGDAVSLCYDVHFASSVTISPIGFHRGASNHACAMVQPRKTTTYVISALGPAGDKDEQPVTVTVR
ncbi:MAG: hypothetical protein P4L56_28170 [Candidatus Sulfopaludibacter sp.]|nr:hypothetical protein [Candidatus Sulfopaludibacter sp.]